MSVRTRALCILGGVAIVAIFCMGAWFRRGTVNVLPQFPSFFMSPAFVDGVVQHATVPQAQPAVSMVVVNHHLLAAHLIVRTLALLATDKPTTVVLVAPDHFAAGIAPITSVVAQWPTPFGTIEPDESAIRSLASSGAVHLYERPFATEHGITNLTMFIQRFVPHVRLVPIVVRDDATVEHIERLAQAIVGLGDDVLVIGSFDFTHDATVALARANDAISIERLTHGNPSDATDIVIDSVGGIRTLMRVAQLRGLSFSLIGQGTSAELLHDVARTDVTSYVTGSWAP